VNEALSRPGASICVKYFLEEVSGVRSTSFERAGQFQDARVPLALPALVEKISILITKARKDENTKEISYSYFDISLFRDFVLEIIQMCPFSIKSNPGGELIIAGC
jgi:hypothetical protein